MKVKTANGEVELTAEMVKPGMVFEASSVSGRPIRYTTFANHPVPLSTGARLVGCDPTIASREDCALYGIAPGIDAGAHGFARLRDGGAVDLHLSDNVRPGMVFRHGRDDRLTVGRCLTVRPKTAGSVWQCAYSGARFGLMRPESPSPFIGLSPRYARPEDVRRLCCGVPSGADGQGTNPITGEPFEIRAMRCTLAIDHAGEHEDIAAAVRWPSEKSDSPRHAYRPQVQKAINADEGRMYVPGVWEGESRINRNVPGLSAILGSLVAPGTYTGSTQGTLRVGDRDFPCLVTERQPPHWRMGRETVTGPRRVTVNLVTDQDVCRALERQVVLSLTEDDKQTRMLVTEWTRTDHASDVPRLTIELEAAIELHGHVRARPAPPRVLCHARSDIDGGFACTEDKGHAGDHVAKGPDGEVCATWAEPIAEQRRDHAVARAIADVPEGCDPGGWANVVRVIAADIWENRSKAAHPFGVVLSMLVGHWRERTRSYAVDRCVHRYNEVEAATRAMGGVIAGRLGGARLFAAYEAGR